MPIIVKDFTWEETESSVYVHVPLKGVSPNKVDIFSSGQYLKVSYPPYVFEVYLREAVNESSSKGIISSSLVKFEFEKCEPELWTTLQAAEVEDKKFMASARQKAVEDAHRKAKEIEEQKAKQKREQERYALREQMKKDDEERRKIEDAKESIRKEATRDLETWKAESKANTQETAAINGQTKDRVCGLEDSGHADDEDDDKEKYTKDVVPQQNTVDGEKEERPTRVEKSPKKTFTKKVKKKKDIPPPRSGGTIEVTFSPRAFKTPSRESKAPEEEEVSQGSSLKRGVRVRALANTLADFHSVQNAWLAKVAAAGRKTNTNDDDAVDVEEMNPIWLKDKGSGFYKSGNYVAAINAFTAAIVLDGSIPSLFSNRAACHLQMKQYNECIQDCTSALELLTPPVQANAVSRCKALVRRGTAQAQLENYVEALVDYESAIKLDPVNASLQDDANKIRHIIQGST